MPSTLVETPRFTTVTRSVGVCVHCVRAQNYMGKGHFQVPFRCLAPILSLKMVLSEQEEIRTSALQHLENPFASITTWGGVSFLAVIHTVLSLGIINISGRNMVLLILGPKAPVYAHRPHNAHLVEENSFVCVVFMWSGHASSTGYGGSLGRYLMEKGADSSIRNRSGLVSLRLRFGAHHEK